VIIGIVPPIEKWFAVLLRQSEWGSGREWGMGRISDFSKTNGLTVVALQFSSEKFILLSMSKGSPRIGMGWTLISLSGGLWVGVFCPNGKRWFK
jgi:hypothetical protein